jgi:DNA-binding NarL/FixJ family response regulator
MEIGVDGFLLKEDADVALTQAIVSIQRGEKFISPILSPNLADLARRKGKADQLTSREREVLKLVAEGKTSQEIAALLYISVFTVRRHRDNIMRKLNLKSLADLVRYAIDQGYTSPAV